jgi:hypothetical protein
MGHTIARRSAVLSVRERLLSAQMGGRAEGRSMKYFKSQAFRALLALSALASSALVLEAAKRWGL